MHTQIQTTESTCIACVYTASGLTTLHWTAKNKDSSLEEINSTHSRN